MQGSITGMVAMTIHVHDLGKVSKFWESVGLEVVESDEESATFAIPGGGPLSLHRWESACATNGGRPPGTVTGLMLAVDDANAVAARIAAAGGTIVAPPFPVEGGRWAVVADPDGNEFMICAPK